MRRARERSPRRSSACADRERPHRGRTDRSGDDLQRPGDERDAPARPPTAQVARARQVKRRDARVESTFDRPVGIGPRRGIAARGERARGERERQPRPHADDEAGIERARSRVGVVRAMLVPRKALIEDANTNSYRVFVIDKDNHAHLRVVQLAAHQLQDAVRLTGGVAEGERVATTHLADLYDGATVTFAADATVAGGKN